MSCNWSRASRSSLAAIVHYRRRSQADGQYGSQSAVLLLIAGLIFVVLGLELLEYRPSPGELGQ